MGTALLALMVVLGCGSREGGEADQGIEPVVVDVATVERGMIPRRVSVTGTLAADEDILVSARVAGRIDGLRVDVGDRVSVGDILVRIDPIDLELALFERRSALGEILTDLGVREVPADADSFDLMQLPAVARARRQADNALARLSRARILLDQEPPLISDQDFEDLRTLWEVAEQDYRLAERSAETQFARARTLHAQVRTAERNLQEATVLAPAGSSAPHPIDGFDERRKWMVAQRLVGPGALVQPGTPLLRLVDLDPLKLRVPVPERRVPQLQVEQSASVVAEGFFDAVNGRVARIAPAIDPRTRTVEVEILVPNSAERLRPGGFARAAIDVGTEDGVILIPADALVVFAGVEKVFTIENGVARERRIETGAREGELLEVLHGLDAGLIIIRAPSETLVTGVPVRINERTARTDSAAVQRP